MNPGFNLATDQNDNWRTPEWLWRALDAEFAFECDGAADAGNTKLPLFCSRIEDGCAAARVFCNPPYSKIDPFVREALARDGSLWVFVLPVRTRTTWFELLRMSARGEFRWFRKRIAFDPPPGIKASGPRMDTFLAVVRPR